MTPSAFAVLRLTTSSNFKAADPDNDGTIDAKELRSAAGRCLVPLLK